MEASFSLIGEEQSECIEGMENFNYLGSILYRSEDNFPEVHQNSSKAF